MSSEEHCKYISSRGFLKACDIHSSTPRSSTWELIEYNHDFPNHLDGTTIYVCSTAVRNFIYNKLPYINYKFVLVTGDTDECVPSQILNDAEFENFINHPNLLRWCSQNCVSEHPKMVKIPIGLDYHTRSIEVAPIDQEQGLASLSKSVQPFWERTLQCYSNFHFVIYETMKFGYMRSDVVRDIPSELVFYEPTVVNRIETWKNQSKYAFVLSPHGNGLDCHRTWEALILGCIPIVRTSPIDSLYEDLPVLIVNEWTDVTEALLKTTVEQFKNQSFSYEKLTLPYWMNKIKQI
jgi:hypothetical protein